MATTGLSKSSCESETIVRLFWPEHLWRILQPQWLFGWAAVSRAHTLDRPQQLLSLVVAGALPQACPGSGAGDVPAPCPAVCCGPVQHLCICRGCIIDHSSRDWLVMRRSAGSTLAEVEAALLRLQEGSSPVGTAADSPTPCVLGVWQPKAAPADAVDGAADPARQLQASTRQRVHSSAPRTPGRKQVVGVTAETAPAAAPDSVARRTRSRTASARAVDDGGVAVGAAVCWEIATERGQHDSLHSVEDTLPAVHIAVGARSGPGADVHPTEDLPLELQSVQLDGRRVSPAACLVVTYRQPRPGVGHLSVGAMPGCGDDAGSRSGGADEPSGGMTLPAAVRLMNRGHWLAAAAAAAAAGEPMSAAPPLPAASICRPPDADAAPAMPRTLIGRLACHSELWRELCRGSSCLLPQLPASFNTAGGGAGTHESSATAGLTPGTADATAANAALVQRAQRRGAAIVSHAAGAAAGAWLLWRRHAVAAWLAAQARRLAWGFIDPQVSLVAAAVNCSLQHIVCRSRQACIRQGVRTWMPGSPRFLSLRHVPARWLIGSWLD